MDFEIEKLDSVHLDILKEIGNIGAGNAATSLSKLLNKRIDMKVPEVKIISFQEVEDAIGGAEMLVAGVYLEFDGDIQGTILFILDEESADNLICILMGRDSPKNKGKEFSEMEVSAIEEIANIMAGAYVGSISTLTGLTLRQSVPELAFDMAGAILSVPMIEYGKMGDKALFIETNFLDGANHVKGQFFLIPNLESYPVILKALGVV